VVAVSPLELREVAEVHPVDPGEEGQGMKIVPDVSTFMISFMRLLIEVM
jgi:hypothetical protein